MQIIEKKVRSTDNKHTLCGKIYVPDGEIKGLVQIVHGMTEHVDRYEGIMTELAKNGFVAFGHNHLGHKGTSSEEELGFFGYYDGFRHLVNDVIAFGNAVSLDFPDKKRVLFGHSMGSFIVRLSILKDAQKLSGLIISGTAGPNKLSRAGLALCNLVMLLKGGRHVSDLVYKLVFGNFNARFKDENSPSSWVSSNVQNREKNERDKYCRFKFTTCAMHDLIKLQFICNKPIWAEAVSKTLPMYIISGELDPVGDYGNGVTTVYDRLVKAGCNVKMKLYKNARHELLTDISREEVTADIINFAAECCK